MQPVRIDTAESQQLFQELDPFIGRVITIQVMAFAKISPAHKNTVNTPLKGQQDVMRRNTCRTHDPHGPDIRGVLQPTDPSQVSSSIRSPRT